MTEGTAPVPVPFGSGKPASMILVRVFGELALYANPIADPDRVLDIGYALFSARASALGISLDGGGEVTEGSGQVGVFQLMLHDDEFPVQPFLTVVGDVISRLGRLRLDAIEVTLPERERAGQRGTPDSGDWFALADRALWVPVRVTLQSPDERLTTLAHSAIDRQKWYQDVFSLDSLSDDHHQVSFIGTVAERSFDALGFLAAYLSDLAARCGITAPLALAVLCTA